MKTDIFEKLETAKSAYDKAVLEIQKDFQTKEGKPAISEMFSPAFEGIPNLEAVRWKQLIPYFNDGEPCIFYVQEPEIKLVGIDNEGDYEDGFMELWTLKYYTEKGKIKVPLSETQVGLIKDLEKKLNKLEDVLEAVFGSHAEITVYRDRVEVEDYTDHD